MAPGWTVLAPALALLAVGPPRPAGGSGEGTWTSARPRRCLGLIRDRRVLDAPCSAARWVDVVGRRALAGVRGWSRRQAGAAALPRGSQAPAGRVLPVSPLEGPGDQDTGARGDGGQHLSAARTGTFHDSGPLCPDTALGVRLAGG